MEMTKIKIALVLSLLALPSIVLGAGTPPSNVENVAATVVGSTVTVSWKAASDDTGIAFYRIYHSRKSILDNGGDYDDFERTKGVETSFTFTKTPVASGPLIIGVLAVDKDGNESEGFETEATVTISAASSVAVSSAPVAMPVGSNPSTTAQPMTINALAPVSATGILIVFSKPLKNTDFSKGYFLLADTGGTIVPVVKARQVGTDMLIEVAPLTPGKVYILSFLNNIPADDGTVMPSSAAPAQFVGFGTPTVGSVSSVSSISSVASSSVSSVAVSSSVSSSASSVSSAMSSSYSRNPGEGTPPVTTVVGDPVDLRIQTTPRSDGTYDIVATWSPMPNTRGFVLYTSLDGTNFVQNSMVGPTDTTVRYTRIRGGTRFGLRVATLAIDGKQSPGASRVVTLPNSGIGLLSVVGAAGALAARRRFRRKKERA